MRETREDQEGVEGRVVQNYILAIAERRQAFLQPVESRLCVYTDLFFNPEFKPVNLSLGCSWVVNLLTLAVGLKVEWIPVTSFLGVIIISHKENGFSVLKSVQSSRAECM